MKFGKTYKVLLPSFPESWRETAIPYSKLKKLIKGVVGELLLLGLDPDALHHLLRDDSEDIAEESLENSDQPPDHLHLEDADDVASSLYKSASMEGTPPAHNILQSATHAVYELATLGEGKAIIPHLRLTLSPKSHGAEEDPAKSAPLSPVSISESTHAVPSDARRRVVMASDVKYVSKPNTSLAQSQHTIKSPLTEALAISPASTSRFLEGVDFEGVSGDHLQGTTATSREIVISLNSDSTFYQVLVSALHSFAEHQAKVQEEFTQTVEQLSRDISNVSHPSSSKRGKSDLYAWRQIFQMWVDAQIFESTAERDRGERSVEDSELKLSEFANKVNKRAMGDDRTLQRKESRNALERFLQINVLLLDLKKFQVANSEAIRKILKKHDKRTALMFPRTIIQATNHPILSTLSPAASRTSHGLTLPHLLVVVLTETLLPIIPSIDDYTCLICTSIAYIPIRLRCSHLFCVRCLVKMQKRGQAECPLCRAPTVLQANRYNVDAALQRLMLDWFPKETKEKDHANQREAAQEQARELGISDRECRIM